MNSQIKQRIDQIRRGEVPEGYKKTKVGIVPEEWEITKLYLISSHVSKKNTNGEVQTTFTNSATQGVIKQTDYFDKEISNKENITSYYVVQENDYIYNPRISVSAPCGPINKSHFSENGIVSPLYTVFRLNDVFQQNKYIEFFFKSSFWHSYMCGIANYGARHDRMNITNYDLFNMPIPFPPIAEQEKIAEILQTQDKVIELQQKKIGELKRLKKGYLSKMFPKKGCNVPEIRFPGFTDAWEQRKFGEVFDCTVPNNTLSRAELSYDEGTVLNVHYGDVLIKYGSVLDVQKDDIPRIPHRCREDFNGALLQDGDIIIADTAEDETTGKACEISNLQGSVIVSGLHTMVCRPRNRMALGYLGYYLNSNAYHHQLLPLMQGIKVLSLSRSNIQKTSVSYPTAVKEQQHIAYYFSQLDNLITLHQRKYDEEKQKKKALMQLLLTGIVRT